MQQTYTQRFSTKVNLKVKNSLSEKELLEAILEVLHRNTWVTAIGSLSGVVAVVVLIYLEFVANGRC